MLSFQNQLVVFVSLHVVELFLPEISIPALVPSDQTRAHSTLLEDTYVNVFFWKSLLPWHFTQWCQGEKDSTSIKHLFLAGSIWALDVHVSYLILLTTLGSRNYYPYRLTRNASITEVK